MNGEPGIILDPGLRRAKARMEADFERRREDEIIQQFYDSAAWARLRYDALKAADGRCKACGNGEADGAVLNVDHIRPLRKYWHWRLEPGNVQVLCGDCNKGKGNRDETDWRGAA